MRQLSKSLVEAIRLPFDCLFAVLPWAFVVGAPSYYAMAALWALVLGYVFGLWVGLSFTIVVYIPISVVVYRRIKHEEAVQYSKYVDRWEGSDETQEKALEFLVESGRKRKK